MYTPGQAIGKVLACAWLDQLLVSPCPGRMNFSAGIMMFLLKDCSSRLQVEGVDLMSCFIALGSEPGLLRQVSS